MKMYIAVREDVPDYIVPTLVAHSVLGAHFKFKDLNEIITNNISLEKFKKFIDTSLKTSYEVSILSILNIL